jgi:hypothetical protein
MLTHTRRTRIDLVAHRLLLPEKKGPIRHLCGECGAPLIKNHIDRWGRVEKDVQKPSARKNIVEKQKRASGRDD